MTFLLRLSLLALVLLNTACSAIFGDTFRDRANDYLTYQQPEAMADQDGLVFENALPVPVVDGDLTLAEEFTVPRPEQLVADDSTQEVASLADYQNQELNPRLEKDGAGTWVLRLDGRFAITWTAVADVLSDASFKLDDMNRSIGTYYLTIEEVKTGEDQSFWEWLFGSEDELVEQNYLLKMNRSRLGVYLSLQKDLEALADDALTQTVLGEINTLLSAAEKQ